MGNSKIQFPPVCVIICGTRPRWGIPEWFRWNFLGRPWCPLTDDAAHFCAYQRQIIPKWGRRHIVSRANLPWEIRGVRFILEHNKGGTCIGAWHIQSPSYASSKKVVEILGIHQIHSRHSCAILQSPMAAPPYHPMYISTYHRIIIRNFIRIWHTL